jgi:hypothetical protein
MENQNRYPNKENLNPVSRKTNEEIDEDETGNLIVGGKYIDENKSVPSDGPFSEDIPKGKNSLTDDAQED